MLARPDRCCMYDVSCRGVTPHLVTLYAYNIHPWTDIGSAHERPARHMSWPPPSCPSPTQQPTGMMQTYSMRQQWRIAICCIGKYHSLHDTSYIDRDERHGRSPNSPETVASPPCPTVTHMDCTRCCMAVAMHTPGLHIYVRQWDIINRSTAVGGP